MQPYTVVGALLLALCALEGARRLNHRADADIRLIDGYIALIRYLRMQIDCYALPISEIFERCDAGLLASCGWKNEGAPSTLEELFLCSEISDAPARAAISSFCRDLGKNYREEELRRCDACISELEGRREAMREEAPNRKKLNLTLCLASAMALIILLV